MSASIDVSYSNEIFRQYVLQVAADIIWKNLTLATDSESSDVDDIYNAELFVTANRNLLNFDIIRAFPSVVLVNSGVPEEVVNIYASDKRKIPENLRNDLVAEYTKALTSMNPLTGRYGYLDSRYGKYVDVYNEKNNYYRMLMGLPDINDTNYVYNTDSRWDTMTPIHLLPIIDRLEMENLGILDELYESNKTKKYIKYLGKRNIDFFTARIAERFEILYRSSSPSQKLDQDFLEAYNRSRYLINSVYYSNAYKNTNKLYENFLAMCIVFMTIQHMQHLYLKVDIGKDFYDADSLKFVYASYEVPFFSEIPLDYHRRIVKNINRLISYKGTSQVFFDLFDIFDLGHMDIYGYYLTKEHAMTSEGLPIFNYELDPDGNIQYDADGNPILAASSYSLKFSKVKIYDDPALSIANPANDLAYSAITDPDPYWIEDAELQQKLAAESFNYLETKYIGIQTIFDLVKITYENAYAFRMIMDNKDYTSTSIVNWTELNVQCTVFDVFIYMCTLYCRFYKFEGIINTKIPAIMDTYGYNFEEATSIINNLVAPNQYLSSNTALNTILDALIPAAFDTPTLMYERIQEAISIISTGLTEAKSRSEYFAYKQLYDSLLVSKELTSVYTDPRTGQVFETYTDILTYYSPDLMQRYLLLSDDAVSDEMNLTIARMERIITSLRYSSLAAGLGTSTMIDSLFKILTFFKSAKAELIGYNVTYVITQRGTNYFKMLDSPKLWQVGGSHEEHIPIEDLINKLTELTELRGEIVTLDGAQIYSHHTIELDREIQTLLDDMHDYVITVEHTFAEYLNVMDIYTPATQSAKFNEKQALKDGILELIFFNPNADNIVSKLNQDLQTCLDVLKPLPEIVQHKLEDICSSMDKLTSIAYGLQYVKDSGIYSDKLSINTNSPISEKSSSSMSFSDTLREIEPTAG